ncbi:MAG: creatininase family protein [Clostridiales bacterium]|nr:creatininase family protein [Clostridiales bacterium]
MKKVLYEELCPMEFTERVKECPVAYLPLGTLEWHGPHLPLGADGIQAQELFVRVAERIGGVVLPKLFLGPDRFYHDPQREFYGMDICTGGTIVPYEMQQLPGSAYWMPDEEYQNMIRQIGANLARAGFKVMVGHGHGPSTWQFQDLREELKEKYGLICVTAFDFLQDDILGYQCDHAAANETAITMAVRPELVQMERIVTGGEEPKAMAGRDPREFASAEYGKQVVDANVKAMCQGLTKILTEG